MNAHDYSLQVRDWISASVQAGPLLSFSDLVSTLPGVHPNDIARELAALGNVTLAQDSPSIDIRPEPHAIELPVPHPLDFDWRFTPETINYVFHRISSLNHNPQGLCFLGAPTLFRAAHERGISSPCYLIDASATSAKALKNTAPQSIFVTDLLNGPIPNLQVAVTVADPPWYEEFVRAFLWAAAQLVQPGGFVFLSFPPLGTRPLIEEEWSRTEEFAQQLGLTVTEQTGALKYVSPPFEQNALRAAQHKYVHAHWRPGILVLLEKTGECRISRPAAQSDREQWIEQSLLGVRWRFRRQHLADGHPLLNELVSGDILNSVSRRDLRRTSADVWTSGNRIYRCQNTTHLALIAKALAAGIRPDTYVSAHLGRELTQPEDEITLLAAKQLATITSRELREYLLN